MNRNEVFDKLLIQLKEAYENDSGLIYIPKFVEDLCGEDSYSRYICEQLKELRIVTPANHNGTSYMWTVMLNSKGSDFIEKYGNWTGYLKAKDIEEQRENSPFVVNVNVTIVNQALEGSLTPEQLREIKEILSSQQNENEKKAGVLQKVKSFGKGVAESVLTNIITDTLTKGIQ